MNNNKIGEFISLLRKEKNLTQKELGELIHVTDKAVSKWERGIGLPEITILKELAKQLDVTVEEILNGEKNNNHNIEEKLKKITDELNTNQKKKIKKITIFIIILFIIIMYISFRNIHLGYTIKEVNYAHTNKTISLGIPNSSFLLKNNDRSYSFKNLRNNYIVENEIKEYLKTLKYSVCNDTIYYYNEKEDMSIIDYSVKRHLLYTTISYEIIERDYCDIQKLNTYGKKLNGLKRIHTMNPILKPEENPHNIISVWLRDGGVDYTYHDEISLKIYFIKEIGTEGILLEESTGTFDIKDDYLYYYRDNIITNHPSINIPKVSAFHILDNGRLELVDNYLSKYEKEIILD